MKNISISYFLGFAKNTWFWLGIWIFFYLRFTDYAGIGLIETTLIVTTTFSEIPTGAVADLLGKKKTLILSFFLEAIGSFIMAMAGSFNHLIISVFIMCVGGAFYSGTIDALIYDTLKERNLENSYDKKISNLNTISLIAPAVCGAIGGYLYKLNPTYPFWANSFGYLLGFFASFFLIEPKIDTEKFSFRNFMSQNTKGVKELFKSTQVKRQTILLLSVGVFVVIFSEMLDSFLGVEFGFSEEQMGILWSVIFVFSAAASLLTPNLVKKFGNVLTTFWLGAVMAATMFISPYVGLIVGGITLLLRSALEGIFSNLSSISINQNTKSEYRATTLSTFNMIKNIPYVLSAYLLGSVSDTFSAKTTSFYMGLGLLIFLAIQAFFHKKAIAKYL